MGVEFEADGISFEHTERLEEAVGAADIVSCATNSGGTAGGGSKVEGRGALGLSGVF